MSRTENVKRNLIFNVVRFVTQLVLQFVLRTVLIYVMGVEYIGLNGLFSNIFTFLNLAELGIGSAIVFAMYKPIAEEDTQKIIALQNLYKKFYFIIALIVLLIGGILTPFVKMFIKDNVSVNINLYILFVMYLSNAVVGYLSAHKRSLLLAYQRNDIEKKISTICLIFMYAIQVGVIFLTKNYYAFFAVNIAFTIIECVVIWIVTDKYFPNIKGKGSVIDKNTKTEITKNVAALSLHKIGGAVIFSTDNILVSSFFGVLILGAYSNYALIITSLNSLLGLIITSLTGSVGNLLASSDKEIVYQKFKQLNFINSFLSAFCAICLFILFQPFIKIWTGGGVYLLNNSTILILCISFYFTKMRANVNLFKDCAGLFRQNKWQPVAEAVINLSVSIILAKFLGINGVFIGTIISTIVAPFWVEPKVLYKHYFNKNVWQYFKRYAIDVLITILVASCCYFVCGFIPDGGLWLLVAKFALCCSLTLVLLILSYCWTPEFKETFAMAKNFLKNVFSKNKSNKNK